MKLLSGTYGVDKYGSADYRQTHGDKEALWGRYSHKGRNGGREE